MKWRSFCAFFGTLVYVKKNLDVKLLIAPETGHMS